MLLLPLLIASAPLLPGAGLWEYTSGLAGMNGKTEQKCFSKAQIEEFLTDPSNRHYDCDYTTRSVGRGRVRLKGVCTSRKHPEQKIGVSLRGAYTTETISLKGTASARVIGSLTLPIAASVTAHRLGPTCAAAPAAAAPPPEAAQLAASPTPGR